MASTHENVAFEAFSSTIRELLVVIEQLASSKGYDMTVDEMAAALRLPRPAPSLATHHSALPANVPPVPGVSNLPHIAGLNGVVPAASAKRSRGKKAPITEDEQCVYVLTRGVKSGTRCPARRAPDNPYFCNGCKVKSAAQKQLETSGMGGVETTKTVPTPNALPMSMAGSLSQGGLITAEAKKLRVKQMPDNLYKETNYNLCLRGGSKPGEYVCIGYYPADDSAVLPLTADLMKICAEHRLNYVDPNKVAPSAGSTMPGLPRAGVSLPSVSGMGSSVPSALPSVGGLPKLPTLPRANAVPAPAASMAAEEGDDEEGGDDEGY